jgi:hypothetical protein
MNPRKKTSQSTKLETPRTDDMINRIQTEAIPFEVSFYQLIDLTRRLEREVKQLRIAQKNRASAPGNDSNQANPPKPLAIKNKIRSNS